MNFNKFKQFAKAGLFFILIISLIGNANAATGHTGGIALSWDDVQNVGPCYENREMFKTYNANCTINIYRLYDWGQGTTDNLSALQTDGWEIAAHGYNHVDSLEFLNNNTSKEWLNQEIFPNIAELTGYGYPSYSFAYPYGSRDNNTDALLAPYFRTLRASEYETMGGKNVNETSDAYYKWDNASLVYGVEIDDQSGVSLESIQYGIDYAIQNGYVLVLYGHMITPTVTGPYQTSTSRLDSILNYTYQKGGQFYLMRELGNSSWTQWSPRFSNVTANFTVSSDTILTGGNVTFTDYSANQTSERLDFGDKSNSSSTANVNHTYTKSGTYTANLTVKNDVSSKSMTKTINVVDPIVPVANFTSNLTTGLSPLSVAFTDTSSGFPSSWAWDFGDGSKLASQNSTHIYSAAGNYTVNLTVSNTNGTNSKTAIITVLQGPVADFNVSATNGYAPLSVTFTDLSKNATSRLWEFGDGKNSTEQNLTYIYSAAGTYTVKLTAININGTNEKTAQIVVEEKDDDDRSNHRSGGSSGGGGGSPEPAKNVEVKELSQVFITNGKHVQFDFTKNATCVVYVGFDSKKTAGKTTTIVEQLKNKSTLVSSLSEGEVYRYFNVWAGNSGFATSTNIENPVICFKVEKSWIKDKKIDKDSIALNRYSNKKWEQLPASLSGEDSKYLYFKSSVPGYSFFAITGKTTENKAGDVITPKSETQENKQNDTGSEANQTSVKRTRAPGFEAIYCIIGLIGVFLYRRR